MNLLRKLLFREMEVFIIHCVWVDSLENKPHAAVGMRMVGYTTSESEAKSIVIQGGMVTHEKCWAIFKEIPKFKFERCILPLSRIKNLHRLSLEEALKIPL